jgi:putative cardiolipin synthase
MKSSPATRLIAGHVAALAMAALLLATLLLAGCATAPATFPRPAPEYAQPPQPDGEFSQLEAKIRQTHGDDSSGFLLLDENREGLEWRLALVDSARHTLDLQYYLWFGDESGLLLMKRVVHAADRGVKVRIIIDDLDTMLRDAATPELRDMATAGIDAHPNIEIRLFNAWKSRSLIGRGAEMVGNMERLNRRMHNKLMIADNRAAIMGGRNIGNEYLGLNADFNFHDLDVLGIGPVARQATGVFDRFWNSEWVMPVSVLHEPVSQQDLKATYEPVTKQLQASKKLTGIPVEPQEWSRTFDALPGSLSIGTSRTFTDSPDHTAVTHRMSPAIRELITSAREEVLITNAYIIPDQHIVDGLHELTQRGVKLRILTNSLATHDVPAVNSHYKQWRKPLIKAGVELYEVRPDAAMRHQIADTPPVDAGFMGLHTKAIVVDRKRVFIGSMNLDPRSGEINSEMGVIVDSPDLARKLADVMARDMSPENSWRVELDPEGDLRWVSGAEVLTSQPARGFMQRVQDVIFMMFPKDYY